MMFRDKKRVGFILLAFLTGGAIPIQLVTLSFGYAQYIKKMLLAPKAIMAAYEFASVYIPWVYAPAMVALLAITLYCRHNYPDIFRRIVVGLSMGAVATIALDAVRQTGVVNGWLPGDTIVMFGKMATGSRNFSLFYPVGELVHYMNGAGFGLFYAFVFGGRQSYVAGAWWGMVWGLLVEIGMMTLPPMAPMVGMFGINFRWPELFILTLVAHIVFGLTLGLLVQHFLGKEDPGGFLTFIGGRGGGTSS